jgi:integrase
MRQRGDAWQLRVYLGRDPVTGRQVLETRTFRGGKRDAQRELARLVAEAERGRTAGSSATVSDLVVRWIETAGPDWSPSTRRQHESAINRHITPLLGDRKLRSLSPSDLDWFYAELRKLPGRGDNTTMAPATVRRIYVIVRAALEQAVKWGWISTNPAIGSSPPKVRQAKIEPPDAEAVSALLETVKSEDHAFFAYLRVAASTGARRSQICGLQWRDIDFDSGRMLFTRGVVDGDQGITVKSTKSDRAYRVAVDAATLGVLSQHRTNADRLAEQCGASVERTGFVFSYEVDGSKPWRPDGVTHRWRRWRVKADLPNMRLHDLRHFMATTMLTAGVPVSVVAGRLGHARSATTLNIYSHFVESGDQAAADLLADLVDGETPGEVGQELDRKTPDVERPHLWDGA